MQGTREDDNRDVGVSPSPTGPRSADDLRAVHTKRRLSTEVLGSSAFRNRGGTGERIHVDVRADRNALRDLDSLASAKES